MADVISFGIYYNLPISRQAVRIAHEIYGKDVASLKGTTRHVTTCPTDLHYV